MTPSSITDCASSGSSSKIPAVAATHSGAAAAKTAMPPSISEAKQPRTHDSDSSNVNAPDSTSSDEGSEEQREIAREELKHQKRIAKAREKLQRLESHTPGRSRGSSLSGRSRTRTNLVAKKGKMAEDTLDFESRESTVLYPPDKTTQPSADNLARTSVPDQRGRASGSEPSSLHTPSLPTLRSLQLDR
jgi:hypothetical protein